ncbi:hypothetical protein C8R42DRAFT_4903 [Lentinula raphanica]|nr:hypothetical protein C8R42DRAFT_4903 [Lentinula raphanica]
MLYNGCVPFSIILLSLHRSVGLNRVLKPSCYSSSHLRTLIQPSVTYLLLSHVSHFSTYTRINAGSLYAGPVFQSILHTVKLCTKSETTLYRGPYFSYLLFKLM